MVLSCFFVHSTATRLPLFGFDLTPTNGGSIAGDVGDIAAPTDAPTDAPTEAPTAPTEAPTAPTEAPTEAPTDIPYTTSVGRCYDDSGIQQQYSEGVSVSWETPGAAYESGSFKIPLTDVVAACAAIAGCAGINVPAAMVTSGLVSQYEWMVEANHATSTQTCHADYSGGGVSCNTYYDCLVLA